MSDSDISATGSPATPNSVWEELPDEVDSVVSTHTVESEEMDSSVSTHDDPEHMIGAIRLFPDFYAQYTPQDDNPSTQSIALSQQSSTQSTFPVQSGMRGPNLSRLHPNQSPSLLLPSLDQTPETPQSSLNQGPPDLLPPSSSQSSNRDMSIMAPKKRTSKLDQTHKRRESPLNRSTPQGPLLQTAGLPPPSSKQNLNSMPPFRHQSHDLAGSSSIQSPASQQTSSRAPKKKKRMSKLKTLFPF